MWRAPKMFICPSCHFPAPHGSLKEPFLNQKWFVHIFNCSSFFTNRCGNGPQPDGATLEFVDDGCQDPVVHLIKPMFINMKGLQGMLGDVHGDDAIAKHLSKIPDPFEQAIGNPWRCPAPAGNFTSRI